MATQLKTFVNASYLESTQTTKITAVALTILDKVTLTNISGANVSFSANIADSGETATTTNLIVKNKAIAPNETYDCFELVGQVIEIGSFLNMIASSANSLVLKIDGREIT